MFKKLVEYGQEYINNLGIYDFGVIKICLLSLGIMLGIAVPAKCKKGFLAGAGILFAFTYAYTMSRFLGIDKCIKNSEKENVEDFYEWAE